MEEYHSEPFIKQEFNNNNQELLVQTEQINIQSNQNFYWFTGLAAAAAAACYGLNYILNNYENENNYLPNHLFFVRLPWCKKKIIKHERLALDCEEKEDIVKALQHYSKIIEMEPGNKYFRNEAARLSLKLK